jgi:hypothetical protein
MSEEGGMDEFCELRPSFFSSSAMMRANTPIFTLSAETFSWSSAFSAACCTVSNCSAATSSFSSS